MTMRKITEVACGVLINRDKGCFLLGSRPEGKPYAGYWEFPGGKLEAGESVHEALVRELKEELDLEIGPSYPWFVMEHDYPHAYVRLHFRRCFSWSGSIRCLENQTYDWFDQKSDLSRLKLLPMDAMIIQRIYLPAIVHARAYEDSLAVKELKPETWCMVQSVEEMRNACVRGCQCVLCAKGREQEILADRMNPLPVYVQSPSDWENAIRMGAHGVCVYEYS